MKAFIMLLRLIGLAAIVLGLLMWNSGNQKYLAMHIAAGFLVVTLVFIMAVIAFTKKAVLVGSVALVLAVLLPVVGFMQLPLSTRSVGPAQTVHFAIAISVLGVAERLHAALRRAG